MREILFRGKRVDNGEWIKGYYVFQKKRRGTFGQTVSEADFDHGCIVAMSGEMHEVVPDTVGQYTGLKDKNGTRIFEGDILRFPYPSNQNIYSVMWSGGSFVRKDPDGYYLSLNALNCDEYEVIGNIHDNPELLGGDD